LLTPYFNRNLALKKGTILKHAQVLALSAAEANSVCLASNQIGLESEIIAINKNIMTKGDTNIHWIHEYYNSPEEYQIFHRPTIL